MRRLFVATHNAHKIREIGEILSGWEIVADDPAGVVEDAPDFAGNALIKVRAIAARHRGDWCLADDSGLEVAALGGAPGVRSARYAGEPSNTPNNNALLLKNLAGVADRRANFTCAVALVGPDGREHAAVGKCFGTIAEKPSGAAGFGYDPLFVPDGRTESFAELAAAEKNAISHRARALAAVRRILEETDAAVFRDRIAGVLETPVTDETRFRDVAGWSSLMAFGILVTLENDYGRRLDLAALAELETVGDLARACGLSAGG